MNLVTPLGDQIVRITANYSALEGNEEDSYPNPVENRSSNSANYGHNPAGTDSSAEFNRLSGELNLRISREIGEVMSSVSAQIQRAINDAISNQVLSPIQNALKAGSGQMTQKGWTSQCTGKLFAAFRGIRDTKIEKSRGIQDKISL